MKKIKMQSVNDLLEEVFQAGEVRAQTRENLRLVSSEQIIDLSCGSFCCRLPPSPPSVMLTLEKIICVVTAQKTKQTHITKHKARMPNNPTTSIHKRTCTQTTNTSTQTNIARHKSSPRKQKREAHRREPQISGCSMGVTRFHTGMQTLPRVEKHGEIT